MDEGSCSRCFIVDKLSLRNRMIIDAFTRVLVLFVRLYRLQLILFELVLNSGEVSGSFRLPYPIAGDLLSVVSEFNPHR